MMGNAIKQQAKNIIVELVRQSPGNELSGKLRLYKAFYFSHLYFTRENCDYLSEWPIVRMPQGPGIDRFSELLHELESEGLLVVRHEPAGPWQREVFRAVRGEDLHLDSTQVDAIRKAVEFIDGKHGAQLSDLTHEFSKSWNESNDGEELNIYRDILADEDFDEMKVVGDAFQAAWNESSQ